MHAETFLEALRCRVRNATVADVSRTWEKPPGRAPRKTLLGLFAWYRGLGETGRALVNEVVAHSLFGALCVLNGARVIEPPEVRGVLILEHVGPTGRTGLNDEAISLHDLW
jgi:hypothetical protein